MYCRYCGTPVFTGSYCPNCGTYQPHLYPLPYVPVVPLVPVTLAPWPEPYRPWLDRLTLTR
jgi:hypothetical protein